MTLKKTADDFYQKAPKWAAELRMLRKILVATPMEETMKWNMPSYTINGTLVVNVAAFSSYFGLWFPQGVLLTDRENVLINAQEGKTKALRQWRMTHADDIKAKLVLTYIDEAIENTKAGKSIGADYDKPLRITDILKNALNSDAELSTLFKALSKARQREFADHINEAKRDITKVRRLEKSLSLLRDGKGLNDKYR